MESCRRRALLLHNRRRQRNPFITSFRPRFWGPNKRQSKLNWRSLNRGRSPQNFLIFKPLGMGLCPQNLNCPHHHQISHRQIWIGGRQIWLKGSHIHTQQALQDPWTWPIFLVVDKCLCSLESLSTPMSKHREIAIAPGKLLRYSLAYSLSLSLSLSMPPQSSILKQVKCSISIFFDFSLFSIAYSLTQWTEGRSFTCRCTL